MNSDSNSEHHNSMDETTNFEHLTYEEIKQNKVLFTKLNNAPKLK